MWYKQFLTFVRMKRKIFNDWNITLDCKNTLQLGRNLDFGVLLLKWGLKLLLGGMRSLFLPYDCLWTLTLGGLNCLNLRLKILFNLNCLLLQDWGDWLSCQRRDLIVSWIFGGYLLGYSPKKVNTLQGRSKSVKLASGCWASALA